MALGSTQPLTEI